jgi:hypothetical protein
VDALFAAFLVLTTIGGDRAQVDSFSTPLLFAYCMLLLAVFSLAFAAIQRQIERRIAKHEFAFSCRVGTFERVVSETRLLCSVREDEEPPPEEDAGKNRVVGVVEIPVLLNKRHSWSRSAAEDKNDGEEDIDSPAATNPFSMIG